MSCDICGRGSCCAMFHSAEDQRRYEPAIELFEKARAMRTQIKEEWDEELRLEEERLETEDND